MKEIDEAIKSGKFNRVYLLSGEEVYLVKKYFDAIKKAVVDPATEMMNYNYFVGKADVDNIISACDTLPFMSENRLVAVKDSKLFEAGRKDDSEKLKDYIQNIPESTVLCFVEDKADKRSGLYKEIKKYGCCAEFSFLKDRELIGWVCDEGKGRIKSDVAEYLIKCVGTAMESLEGEIDKLLNYLPQDESVTRQTIDSICTKSPETNVFDMVEAIGKKQPAKALEIYNNMLRMKQSPFYVLKTVSYTHLAFVFLIIVIICVVTYPGLAEKKDLLMDVNLYYYNAAENTVVPEKRSINKSDNANEIISSVELAYKEGPKTPGLTMPFPEGVSFEINNNDSKAEDVLDINITGSFDSLKETERLICIGSLVYTFTDIDSVEDVRLFVEGKSVSDLYGMYSELNRENTVNNPIINPEKIDRQDVVLYFLDAEGKGLAAEERSIEVKQSQTLEYQIVEQLTMGPVNESLKAAVPQGTKIKDCLLYTSRCV